MQNQGQTDPAITMSERRDQVMRHVKTILVVACDGQSTLMVIYE